MAAFAVMLMALLVVQAPIATVDRLLHAMGQGHAANAFAGAVLDAADHDHDDHHDDGPAGLAAGQAADVVEDGASVDPSEPGPHHHHHHDSPSVYSLTGAPRLPVAWTSSSSPFGAEDDLRRGLGAPLQDRPPKARLAHVA
jgi:hypothetical protein